MSTFGEYHGRSRASIEAPLQASVTPEASMMTRLEIAAPAGTVALHRRL
jgi:hypothetical protein